MTSPSRFSSEHWLALAPILDQALELEGSEREAYLDAACGRSTPLRASVDRLLAADAAASDFLEQPAESYFPLPPATEEGLAPGTAIGPFRVIREAGRGGMGLVYLAERADGQFEQRVALKLVRAGPAAGEIHRRFLAERQILARLDHPHIARLVDGGLAEGRPWLAMEYVDGAPLLEWCDARRFDISARLKLFTEVCDAVRYAHQKLVVHRDLKPSNILVTAGGGVKLLDFGIAKLLDPDAEQGQTRTELRLLTPEYAAPEQVRGEPVTTATDVYALGAVLYELLTGQPVHQFARNTPAEFERVICETMPLAPSQAALKDPELAARRGAEPARLRRQLQGDLDTVILRALQKEPGRRYLTADALLADLGRYLDGSPVEARPDSGFYRLGKFVRRHWLGVTAGVAVLLSLILGLAVASWQARRAAREAARATAVKEFLVGLFQGADPDQSRGTRMTVQQLLEEGTRRVDSALGEEPGLRGEMLAVLGDVYWKLGLLAPADSLLRRALQVTAAADPDNHADIGARLTSLGTVLRQRGELASAESVLHLGLAEKLKGLGPDDPDVAVTMNELAIAYKALGNLPAAESLHRATLALDRRLLGPEHLEVATDLNNLGVFLDDAKSDYVGAESLYRAALAIRLKQLDPDHPDVLTVLGNLATVAKARGRYSEAESLRVRALAGLRRQYPEGHPDIAYGIQSLAAIREAQGRLAEAVSLDSEALAIRIRALGPEHPVTISTINNLAVLRFRMGDFSAAVEAFRHVVASWRSSPGVSHPSTMAAINNLGAGLTELGEYEEAGRLLEEALRLRRQAQGDSSPDVGSSLRNLGVLDHRRGRLQEAAHRLEQATVVYRAKLPAGHPRLAETLTELGSVLTDQGRPREAVAMLEEALGIRVEKLGVTDIRTGETRLVLGRTLGRMGRTDQADSLVRESLRAFRASPYAARWVSLAEADLRRLHERRPD